MSPLGSYTAWVRRRWVAMLPAAVVEAGSLLVAVSGQPIFLLQGHLPSYRTIRPGDSGPDVEALQFGLAAAGFDVEVDGTYGSSTWDAVGELWTSNGFDPVVDLDLKAQVEAADKVVGDLLERDAANRRAERAGGPPAPDLNAEYRAAQEHVADLKERFGPQVPLASVVFAPDVPSTVVASRAGIGDDVTMGSGSRGDGGMQDSSAGPLLELSASPPILAVEATAAQISMLSVGLGATTRIDGTEVAAEVVEIGELGAAGTARVELRPEEPVGMESLGSSVAAEVETVSTSGAVLAVPASALRSYPGEPEQVVRLRSDVGTPAQREAVAVKTGLVVGGWVEVVSSTPELGSGDRVVVGG